MNIKQTIYIELLNEGTQVWRPVSATHIEGMIFRINENMPEDESWLFKPTEIVECKNQQFSDGKIGLVAFRSLTSNKG